MTGMSFTEAAYGHVYGVRSGRLASESKTFVRVNNLLSFRASTCRPATHACHWIRARAFLRSCNHFAIGPSPGGQTKAAK